MVYGCGYSSVVEHASGHGFSPQYHQTTKIHGIHSSSNFPLPANAVLKFFMYRIREGDEMSRHKRRRPVKMQISLCSWFSIDQHSQEPGSYVDFQSL
jgi:hypothetical protein